MPACFCTLAVAGPLEPSTNAAAPPLGHSLSERAAAPIAEVQEKSAAVLAEHRPGLLCDLMRRHLLPAPRQQHVLGGGTAGCAVHHLLPPVVEQLALTTHQRRSILQIWQQYQHRMAAVRQRARQRIGCMQEVAGRRQALGQGAQQGGQAAARAEPPLSAVMQVTHNTALRILPWWLQLWVGWVAGALPLTLPFPLAARAASSPLRTT